MALVGRSHGGDAGGDPPSTNWNPKSGCAAIGAKQKRGAALNRKLQDKRRAHGGPLPVEFDINDKGTYMPVGPNHTEFSNLCGSLARRVPLHHDGWVQVPAGEKAHVMPELEDYFDLSLYKEDPIVMNAIDQLVASRYRGAKTKFKSKHFTARGGLDKVGELRDQPPANISLGAWHQLMDAYVREDNVARAQRNKGNREHQSDISRQGRQSIAARRHAYFQEHQRYPSSITNWGEMHMAQGTYIGQQAALQHEQMRALWVASVASGNPRTEDSIMDEVLGTRNGHLRGRGRKARVTSVGPEGSGPSQSQGSFQSTSTSQSQGVGFVSIEEYQSQQAQFQAQFQAQQAQMAQMQAQMQMWSQQMSNQGFGPSQAAPPPRPASPPEQTDLFANIYAYRSPNLDPSSNGDNDSEE